MNPNRGLTYFTLSALAFTAPLSIFAQTAQRIAPVPADNLELSSGYVQSVRTPESRAMVVDLLRRARDSYALRTAGQGYDLKATFTVNSGGQTQYDGAWQMEDMFDPSLGLHWTASTAAGYSITEISSNGKIYSESNADYIPLRLQEARAALFDPLPSSEALTHANFRASTSEFQGAQVTCLLFSQTKRKGAGLYPGRRWNETESCIDPQSGLLRVASQAPGRYFTYDYSDALQFGGRMLPRKVTVTEAGKVVSEISVESLTPLTHPDPNLFIPTPQMKDAGSGVKMAGAEKIVRAFPADPSMAGAPPHAVCVFGLVTPTGQLVDAHSLQPSDPYSPAALTTAKEMNFAQPPKPGEVRPPPEQHFVFVIERFGS